MKESWIYKGKMEDQMQRVYEKAVMPNLPKLS
jgi:hypothetical protein